jgi:transcriptional regulator with XRE-family HTH domain
LIVAVAPSSSAQRARQELAGRLREIRLDAGLTARALSAEAGWHEAKTSRIESARQAPGDADIRTWCRVCGAEGQAEDLIAASRAADSMYIEWRRVHRTGLRRTQESVGPLYERTRLFRVYCSNVVPGFFQTPGYAGALLSTVATFRGTPNDVEDAVVARMGRNRILHTGDHRFAIVVEESVLRYRLGDSETMAGQLGHLLGAIALPSVRLGIIPFTADSRPIWPLEQFTVFDDARVHVELLSAQVTVTTPGEVALYLHGFARLAELAVYGAKARSLITSAIEALG